MDNISSLSSFVLANQIREILFSAHVDASRKQKTESGYSCIF